MAASASTGMGTGGRHRGQSGRLSRGGCRSLGIGILLLGAVLGSALVLVGCASRGPAPIEGWDWKGPVPPGYYLVRSGDTLSEIAERRRVSTPELIRWNRLKPPYVIYAGKLLRVAAPDRGGIFPQRAPDGPAAEAKDQTPHPPKVASGAVSVGPASRSGLTWGWPLNGALHQGFREGDRTRQGLRIRCRPGESVRAAAGGQVVYAGSGLTGYGNLIIVKHNEKYLSAYGFNRRLLVAEGDGVKRGQAVAECGQGAGGVHLMHFEIRRDGVAIDPTPLLPPRP